jgi:hypothetical protein
MAGADRGGIPRLSNQDWTELLVLTVRWTGREVLIMRRIGRRRSTRGGVLLDAVLAVSLIILGAFLLDLVGVTLSSLLQGAGQFFGW